MEKQSSLDAFIDIHICGACKSQFNNVEVFLLHKSQCPSLAELRAKMAAKMSSASSLEANGNNESPRTTEGEVASIKHLVQAAESQLVSSQQISSSESEVDSRHSTSITVQSGTGQSMVLTKDGILQAQEDSTSGWSQVEQNTPTSSVMFLSSEEAAVFQKTKEASLEEKNKISRSEDNHDLKQLQPAQTIYVEAIQQPEQDYDLNRVKTKEEQFSGVSLSLSSGGSPRQGERTEVIVTETMLTASGQQGMATESGSLLPNAELVNQGEHYLVSEEGEASEVQSVMYSEETPLPPLRPFTSIRGQELMLAIDDPVSPSRKKYKCTFAACNFITLYVRDLERHVRTHTGERPFQCMHCSKAFSRSDKLKIHLRGHTGSKPFKCHYCDYGAADSSSLRKHLRIHTDERPFKCQICPYASRNSSQLIVHLRTHTGDTPFQCSLCDAKFKINSDLKRHMRTHTGEKPYGCELCDYRCSIRGNLKSHIRINHSNENEVKCNYCDFQTSSRKLLREHKKIHDTTHPVKCPTCNYCCANNSALKAHMRIHSDERPFNCNFCSYSSKQSGNVKTHVRKKHPEKLLGDRKPGRTVMKKGARAVATNTPSPTKTREERGYGSNLKPNCKKTFSCNICTAAFVREDSLRSHMRQHCKEIAQNLESTALAVLQLQNAGPSDSQMSDTVVSTIASMVQPGDQIETEMEAVMVASPSSIVSSVNVVQSPVVSHTIQTSAQMAQQRMNIRRKRSSSRGGLQDIAEAAATLSQIPHGCPSPVRPTSPYQHQQQQYVTTSRAHTSANMGFPDDSLSLGQLPPTSEHQNMHHQQFIQSSQSMQVLQNPYPGLKLMNNKPYPSNDGVPHSLPHHHQVVQHMNPHQLPRGIAQQSDAGAINLQVVQPPDPYPVSLVTRDLQLQQQQNQHQQQQQQQQQQQHQQHMHQSQLAQHAHPQHLQPQQHPQQQQQHHHGAASATQPAQIQIILPSSGFSSPHHANQQVPQVSLPGQVSQPGRPQIVVQFQEPAVSTPAPQPNVITLSSSVCQALISQMRMQDSIAGQNTGYQPDSTSVTSQEVVVAVDAQGATSSHGVHLNKVVQ